MSKKLKTIASTAIRNNSLNLEAIKCFSENFKIEDFQNCEILQDKIKAEMIRYCLEQRLIELKNCSDEFDKEKRSLDATKVKIPQQVPTKNLKINF